MEYHQEDMLFLKEKIEEIKVALFKADSDSLLRLPNNIISTLRVDMQATFGFSLPVQIPMPNTLIKNCMFRLITIKKK